MMVLQKATQDQLVLGPCFGILMDLWYVSSVLKV
jgi:hypothetical protein